ncbi:30S ribosomal protein S12 methylthiotransferase RimO [Brumicola pallidula]|uniref:Ribosomal protein uS12 methylthiotransferase RimO n=1 Tax=Brumicola pallidula DSM 14239 = ACAM 615 TaxID=1121922 RepID=K6ZD08_9ALTE|nr:30S ribosomal protein S12 methylthiotransferase RimO [Glaciecola pallidula]GAC28237.1 ribosomal protein S12 methylthiotransferase [Glaciecola pallidula DSM 14239 = ACAM 615]
MTVKQFNPKQTTTMDGPKQVIKEQSIQVKQLDNAPPTSKIGFVSLGCPKNLVDSERILTQLRIEGYDVVSTYDDAALVIVNTCGFIDSAVQESLDTIGEALAKNGKVIVTGCLGIKEDQIREVHPNVLSITGPHAYEEVVSQVHEHLPKPEFNPFLHLVPDHGVKLTPKHFAYLKISEGCNHRCTFCIIPSMRGDLVSRPVGDVLGEAKRLKAAGVTELLVISQDTSAYGVDVKYKTDFWDGMPVKTHMQQLCEKLGEMDMWIRLHYVYPYPHVDDLIPLMAEGKILPYLDIPFQHANKRILRLMKRPGSADRTIERIRKWREICPELIIRSTFIVGFPGETEEEFEELLTFLEEAQLDRVGCFKYSPVDGAKANDLPDPINEDIKDIRLQRFMQVQSQISKQRLIDKIGSEYNIVIDSVDAEGAVGRTFGDAPEIDGVVHLNGVFDIQPGQRLWVEIIHTDEHDLWAVPVEEQEYEQALEQGA